MTALIITIHVIVCIALILIVLLQTGKGADMGAVFGGAGSQALFGNTGAATFLGKMTTVAAVVFMITSLTLAYISKSGGKSVVSDIQPATQQTQTAVPDLPTPITGKAQTEQNTPVPADQLPAEVMPSEPMPTPEDATETPSSE